MQIPERDGDGYLTNMNEWSPELGRAMALEDGIELDDEKWEHILKAREFFEEHAVAVPIVPPQRLFDELDA